MKWLCAICSAECVPDDRRNGAGIGFVFWNCPECLKQTGFQYDGGTVDLELLRQVVPNLYEHSSFELFP